MVQELNHKNEMIPDTRFAVSWPEREKCFADGWGRGNEISIHPASGGGGVTGFFFSLMYFGVTDFFFNRVIVVVHFCAWRLLERKGMEAHMVKLL